ncbi:MAG: transketolase [Gammaproteobacteria bacterium]
MSTHRQRANAIRALSMDAVQQADSGHPGMPMGMADIAEVLWLQFLKYDPKRPTWADRDRFVLSNGHGSMMLYSVLHLTGYDLSINDLKAFRQLHSKTPGHPEYGHTPGVETTTGPLGAGICNAVGMALTERMLAARFNRPGFSIVDHHTYVFMGDGCMMEGLSHEAASLAGTQRLNKLIAVWDDNGISIDGPVAPWFSENIPQRFEAYGWHVIPDVDGHDAAAIEAAFTEAKAQLHKPTLICARTKIGFGSPSFEGSSKTHGSPLGKDEITKTRDALDWPYAPFEVPADLYHDWSGVVRGEKAYQSWQNSFADYEAHYPEEAAEYLRVLSGALPKDFDKQYQSFIETHRTTAKTVATRKSSQQCIEFITKHVPEVLGGSADLSVSNLTIGPDTQVITSELPGGNYIEYGVREFGMAGIMNGIALHGGVIPFCATFLVFSDYARNAIRLSALMRQRVIYVFTHDSIGVGEDGPTHQPIEHLASLRLIPHLDVWRPCDTVETAVAWEQALRYQGPSVLACSRQNVSPQSRTLAQVDLIQKGGYILSEHAAPLQLVIMATGSEVDMAMAVKADLEAVQIGVRVVSMPCFERFQKQDAAYQAEVLPKGVHRVAVEAGVREAWLQWVPMDAILGLNDFGYSAPAAAVYEEMGLTKAHLQALCVRVLCSGE